MAIDSLFRLMIFCMLAISMGFALQKPFGLKYADSDREQEKTKTAEAPVKDVLSSIAVMDEESPDTATFYFEEDEDDNKQSTTGGEDVTEIKVKNIHKDIVVEELIKKMRLEADDLVAPPRDEQGKGRKVELSELPLQVLELPAQDQPKEEQDTDYRVEEVVLTGQYMGKDCLNMRATGCYNFRFKKKLQSNIESAHLWVYKTKDLDNVSNQTFAVHELEQGSLGAVGRHNLLSQHEMPAREGWLAMNVTRSVQQWAAHGRDGVMVALTCTTCRMDSFQDISGAKRGYQPLLVIKFADKHNIRSKRSGEDCDRRVECCMRPLFVNLHDIGLNHIITPTEVDIKHCVGRCGCTLTGLAASFALLI